MYVKVNMFQIGRTDFLMKIIELLRFLHFFQTVTGIIIPSLKLIGHKLINQKAKNRYD